MELGRGSEVKSCSSCVWGGKRGSELHVYTPRPDGQIACLEDFEEVGLLALLNLSYMTDWTIYTICRRKLDQKDIQQHPSTEINPSYARAGPKGLDVSSRDSDTRGL